MKQETQIGKTKWISIQEPDKKLIDKLAKEYGFHEVIVDDLVDINAQSKIDRNSNNFFLALTFTKYIEAEQKYVLNELDVIIWKDYIITTTSMESKSFKAICETIKKEAEDNKEAYKESPYYILYRIIDTFYDNTMKHLSLSSKKLLTIQDEIASRRIEKWLVEDLMNEDLNKIFIKHNFLSQNNVMLDLVEHISWLKEGHLNVYFNSLRSKLHRIISTINVLSERIDSLMSAYDTFVWIKNNDTITRLTFVNAIFMPLTLIAGIGGMSEWSMMTGPDNWRLAYPMFLVLCAVIAWLTFFLLRRYFMKK